MPGTRTISEQVQGVEVHLGQALNTEQEIREAVITEKKLIDGAFIRLARHLAEINQKELYIVWGFSSFEEYVKNELEYGYRKADYLVSIWNKMKHLHIPVERLEAVGWTKAVELARVITPDDAEIWMERAETMSYRDLVEEVKKVIDHTYEDTRPTFFIMKIRFDSADMSAVNDALAEAKSIYETEDTAMALSVICGDWLENKGMVPQRSTIDDYVKWLYKVFGVCLIPTDIREIPNPESYGVDPTTLKYTGRQKAIKRERAEKAAKTTPGIVIVDTTDIQGSNADIDDVLLEPESKDEKSVVKLSGDEVDEFLESL